MHNVYYYYCVLLCTTIYCTYSIVCFQQTDTLQTDDTHITTNIFESEWTCDTVYAEYTVYKYSTLYIIYVCVAAGSVVCIQDTDIYLDQYCN